jgi:hypothetical protein
MLVWGPSPRNIKDYLIPISGLDSSALAAYSSLEFHLLIDVLVGVEGGNSLAFLAAR